MKLISSKKGEEGTSFSLTQLIGIVIAILVVVGIYGLTAGIYSLFYADKVHQGTDVAFEELVKAIEDAEDGDLPIVVSYYIEDGFKIVGFNRKDSYALDSCWRDSKEAKPAECGDSACLVLCGEEEGDCKTKLKDYRVFEDINFILAKDLDKNQGKSYMGSEYFILYGDCGLDYRVRTIYVKKESDKIIISSK